MKMHTGLLSVNAKREITLCIAVAAAAVFAGGTVARADSTVVVDPDASNGWTFQLTDSSGALNTGSGTGEFVTGPATPPIGTGSAHFVTPANGGDQSVQLRSSNLDGVPLASLTQLTYSTYVTDWNGSQAPVLNLYVDTTGGNVRNDRIWFEPVYSEDDAGNGDPNPQPHVTTDTWQTWNVLQGMVYNDNGPSGPGDHAITFASYLASNPNATIVNPGDGAGGIRLFSGFASPSNDFDTNVDDFTVGVNGVNTTYDFEAPEPASLGLIGLSGLALLHRRRK